MPVSTRNIVGLSRQQACHSRRESATSRQAAQVFVDLLEKVQSVKTTSSWMMRMDSVSKAVLLLQIPGGNDKPTRGTNLREGQT